MAERADLKSAQYVFESRREHHVAACYANKQNRECHVQRTKHLSAYDLACGYVQRTESESLGERVTLSGDMHHTCYWVHHYRSGLHLAIGYINYKQSYRTLTEARRAYNVLARDISRRTNQPVVQS